MSRPDGVTGCESDEISQKVCLGDAVGASDLQMLDAPFFQNRIPGFCADAQYLAHLVDVQHVRVIPKHDTVGITRMQSFFWQRSIPPVLHGAGIPVPGPGCILGHSQFAAFPGQWSSP